MSLSMRSGRDDAAIDRRAVSAPKDVERSIEGLATYLAGQLTGERDRARAIFRWITHNIAYDVHALATKPYGDLSPPAVLSRRAAVCQGYSGLFLALARAARLTAVTVSGYSKGYSYAAGLRFYGDPNHAWNAVQIHGQWYLMDCTWGAGHVDERTRFVREFDEHYFLTPADEFIYDHLPDDPRWQLLPVPISKREFEELVYVKSSFFKNRLELVSHRKSIIAANGELVVTLRSLADVALLARLQRGDTGDRASSLTIDEVGARYDIRVPVLQPGGYILRVFAKRRTDQSPYIWALDYKIEARPGITQVSDQPPKTRQAAKRPWWRRWWW